MENGQTVESNITTRFSDLSPNEKVSEKVTEDQLSQRKRATKNEIDGQLTGKWNGTNAPTK